MTYKEKLRQEHPDKISEEHEGGCIGCPYEYGYCVPPEDGWCLEHTCEQCWNREIPSLKSAAQAFGDHIVEIPCTGLTPVEYVDTQEFANAEPRILDSGERRQFETGAVRDIQEGKGRCDLMPLEVLCKYFKKPIFGLLGMFLKDSSTAHLYECIRLFSSYYGEETNAITDCTMFLEVAKHFEEGSRKYGENNWQKGLPVRCYIDSAVRHYLKWLRGDTDEPHDRAFVWNVLCCIWECEFSPRAKSGADQDAPVMVLEHVTKARSVPVAYLCDREACPVCDNPQCYYTEDIAHAVNFEAVQNSGASRVVRYLERQHQDL